MNSVPGIGAKIGDYRVVAEVARGGQGVVYRATRADEAPVALKLLLDVEEESLARFEREALQLARIQHPNVVKVHEYGVHANKPFLVMEWIDGESLHDRLRTTGPLPSEQAVDLLRQVARALEHCHGLGLVHRDVKPQNVVLHAERGAVLVDFGLVHAVRGEGGQVAQRLTVTGEILGTPAYMAPEQADASFGEIGPASDVYALGATLYFALTAIHPLDTSGGLASVLLRLLEQPPPDPRALQPHIPEALAQLCLRCLAKRPEDRCPDTQSFLAALEASLPAKSAQTRRAWTAPALLVAAIGGSAALASLLAIQNADRGVAATPSSPPAPAAPPRSSPSARPSPARSDRPAPTSTPASSRLKRHIHALLSRHEFDRGWLAIQRALQASPRDVNLLSIGISGFRGNPGQEERLFDLLGRLQAIAPTPGAALEAGRVAHAKARLHAEAPQAELRWLNRAIETLEAGTALDQPRQGVERDLRFELGTALARRAAIHYDRSFEEGETESARAIMVLEPLASPDDLEAQHAVAQLLQRRLEQARKTPLPLQELRRRLDRAATFLRQACVSTTRKTRPLHEARVALLHTALLWKALGPTLINAYHRDLADAYRGLHAASPGHPARGNFLIYSQVLRSAALAREDEFARSIRLLEPGFTVKRVDLKRRKHLAKVYAARWGTWKRHGPTTWRSELRATLDRRPWRSTLPEDRAWIQKLEESLRTLLN